MTATELDQRLNSARLLPWQIEASSRRRLRVKCLDLDVILSMGKEYDWKKRQLAQLAIVKWKYQWYLAKLKHEEAEAATGGEKERADAQTQR